MLIEPRPSDDLGLVLLLDLALKELITRYPDSSSTHAVDPATSYLVAAGDGDAVGCIGLMPVVDGLGEIKRMFVHEDHRGSRDRVAAGDVGGSGCPPPGREVAPARHRHPPAGGGRAVRIRRVPAHPAVREVRRGSAGALLPEANRLIAVTVK